MHLDYFFPFNQSDDCFLALSLPLPSSLLRLLIGEELIFVETLAFHGGNRICNWTQVNLFENKFSFFASPPMRYHSDNIGTTVAHATHTY